MDGCKGNVRTLREMKQGETGRIIRFCEGTLMGLRKLMAFGILPGESLVVLQTFPSYVIAVGRTQIALDKVLAMMVEVEVGK